MQQTHYSQNKDQTTVTKPTIGVTAPARVPVVQTGSDIVDVERLDRAYKTLSDLGWSIKEAANVRRIYKGFAGDDISRAKGFESAFLDPQVDVVMGARGGYGTTRLLNLLDWETLVQSNAVFVGLSDLTAINMALMRYERASWQGPVITGFAKEGAPCAASFMRAMTEQSFELQTRVSSDDLDTEGVLWGGNLSMLVSLLGTAYFPTQNQFENGILFVEDINEPAWRIERMLNQLILAGVLTRQQVLIVGDTTGHERWQGEGNAAFKLQDALDYVQEKTGVKIITGLKFGHVSDTLTLPVGVGAKVQVKDGILTIKVPDSPRPSEYPGAQTANGPLWWV